MRYKLNNNDNFSLILKELSNNPYILNYLLEFENFSSDELTKILNIKDNFGNYILCYTNESNIIKYVSKLEYPKLLERNKQNNPNIFNMCITSNTLKYIVENYSQIITENIKDKFGQNIYSVRYDTRRTY